MSECGTWTIPDETYSVIVRFPKPLRTRIAETWTPRRKLLCIRIISTINCLSLIGFIWMLFSCLHRPDMKLKSLSIRDTAAYQNTTGTAWQVDSAFDVTLSTWNPNMMAGCIWTFQRVMVRVDYKSQTILQREVPLGFGLKPRGRRPVTMELQAQEVQLQNPDRGPVLEAELRGGNVTLDVYFDALCGPRHWFSIWVNIRCQLVSTTPSNSSASSLLSNHCKSTD